MASILLGLTAALAWGIHDICVRHVGRRTGILPAILTVLASGAVLVLPLALFWGDWTAVTGAGLALSLASGIAFVFAAIGLYKAFFIGPIRLVAPIVASYPILSVGWAALSGQAVPLENWLAVLTIVLGVSVVAVLSDDDETHSDRTAAIGWAIASGAGFAVTFALGQAATRSGAELPVILISRVAAIGGVVLVAMVRNAALRPVRSALPLLLVMGFLDAVALSAVLVAGVLPNPEFAAVVASTFGIITILLAWAVLRERMTVPQWLGVIIVFCGILWLGGRG